MTAPARRFKVGDVIDGRYEVVEVLPSGGMGELYKVLHVHLNDFRAVKILKSTNMASETDRRRFMNEAKIAASIKQPNVAALYDFSTLPDGTFYMVEEFIDGVTLSAQIRGGKRFTPADIVLVAQQVLRGLAAIHDKHIIHRDISPDNLMLARDSGGKPLVKIIDLGIAKPIRGGEGLTRDGFFVGKPYYASPEHIRLKDDEEGLDHRTDLYSLGVVLFQMATGTVPFDAPTPVEYMIRQSNEDVTTTRVHAGVDIPDELDAFIVRLVRHRPSDRYGTAAEALQHLSIVAHKMEKGPEWRPTLEIALSEANIRIPGFERAKTLESEKPTEVIELSRELPLTVPVADRTPADATTEPQLPPSVAEPPAPPVEPPAEVSTTDATVIARPAKAAAQESFSFEEPLDRTIVAARPKPAAAAETPSAGDATVFVPRGQATPPADATIVATKPKPKVHIPLKEIDDEPIPEIPEAVKRRPAGPVPPRKGLGGPAIAVIAIVVLAALGAAAWFGLRALGIAIPGMPVATAPVSPASQPVTQAPAPAPAAPAITETVPPAVDTAAATSVVPAPELTTTTPPPPTTTVTETKPAKRRPRTTPATTAQAKPSPAPEPEPPKPAAPRVREGELVTLGDGVVDAQITESVKPVYPPLAAQMNAEGSVIVSVLVGTDGSAEDAKVLRGSGFGMLDDAALSAARRMKFSPATKEGVKVRIWKTVPFQFKRR